MYKQCRNYENINKAVFDGDGIYDIPIIFPQEFEKSDFIGFNYVKTCADKELKSVHFFLDDYQFNRLWTDIDRYIPLLKQFRYVLTPDFSMYTDFPKAMQIYNHYRKHWIGAYMQEKGIKVIPTISWSDHDSYSWCFDGEPKGGCVAVSSVGTQNSKKAKQLFIDGYAEMVKKLKPTQIIFYGSVPDECKGNIIRCKQFTDRFCKAEVSQW